MNDESPNGGEFLAFMDRTAREAGKTLLRYFRTDFGVDPKGSIEGGIDIVTDADRASEEIILGAISREFPDHDILAEETGGERTGSQWLWLVDPLDGTVNFAHGYGCFTVSLALLNGGTTVAGIVYDPFHDEMFSASKAGGAHLNGRRISVSQAESLNRSIVATGFPYDRAVSPDNNVAQFSRVVPRVQGMRRAGSAAMDLAFVSCGRLDGFWELKLNPWDQAAGMLLVEEAGGRVTDGRGKPTDPFTKYIVATNGRIHHLLLELLAG